MERSATSSSARPSTPRRTLRPHRPLAGLTHRPTAANSLLRPQIAMNNEQFWGLLDQARGDSPESADPDRMRTIVEHLSDDEVMAFGLMFYEKLCDLNNWWLWGAGYVIAGGMSDDSFHYFRSWIIGKG